MLRDCYHTSVSMDHQRRAHENSITIIKRVWRRGGEKEEKNAGEDIEHICSHLG